VSIERLQSPLERLEDRAQPLKFSDPLVLGIDHGVVSPVQLFSCGPDNARPNLFAPTLTG
jgi:hypothetical protein